ncbi:uncharacterized protein [Hyperolius riggenbachi]|uniref:uncharacterized protein n=1 Tax=Hyperolius riggenbachi TaxID=752182 RepID=UPI0035A367EB
MEDAVGPSPLTSAESGAIPSLPKAPKGDKDKDKAVSQQGQGGQSSGRTEKRCVMCNSRFYSSSTKKLCQSCREKVVKEESPVVFKDLMGWMRSEMASAIKEIKDSAMAESTVPSTSAADTVPAPLPAPMIEGHSQLEASPHQVAAKRKRKDNESGDSDLSGEEGEISSLEEISGEEEENPEVTQKFAFAPNLMKDLLSAMQNTMGITVERESLTPLDQMYLDQTLERTSDYKKNFPTKKRAFQYWWQAGAQLAAATRNLRQRSHLKRSGFQIETKKGRLFFPGPTNPISNDASIPVGGRLSHYYETWCQRFTSQWLLKIVLEGYKIEFEYPPPLQYVVTPQPKSPDQRKALQEEVASLLEKRVIREVPSCQRGQGFYSPVFLIKKPQGAFRFILNLKGLNRAVKYRKFRMDNVKSVITLLQKDCFLASLDLKDAYLHVPVHLESQQFLRFAIHLQEEKSRSISIRKAMALLGLLSSVFPAVQWGQFHARNLQLWILRSWNRNISALERKILIPYGVKVSLNWWQELSHLSEGRMWFFPVQRIITTDASRWGWGAHMDSLPAQGQWSRAMAIRSSNSRELEAVWRSLQFFKDQINQCHVLIRSDNSSVVAYLNHQGGTRSRRLWSQTARILHWAESNLTSVRAVHLKGTCNVVADYLSRSAILQDEWSLNPEVFVQISQAWGTPAVDLFARRQNSKCLKFCSLYPKDNPWEIDAFSIEWRLNLMYAFPPIPLISRVLNKIMQDRAQVILIVPFWPKRPWFALLQNLAMCQPIMLPVRTDLLSQGPVLHPDFKRLHLSAWRLSGES